jgi:peptidoglycan/LPS O-acetylase OafA/YrhL
MSRTPPARLERLEPLDALRGFAALGVAVFSHYQHWNGGAAKETYPFAKQAIASWLYANSWLFVDLFFLMSGVVMTLRYLAPLIAHSVSAREFFWLRFSRLYPLHFATLAVCAVVEWSLLAAGRPAVIYPNNNDLYHFILHATYLQSGWFDRGWSYNMPSWSVASEAVAYVAFFVLATRYRRNYPLACVGLFLFGMGVQTAKLGYPFLNDNVARATIGFSLGSLLYLAMDYFDRTGRGLRFGLACFAGFIAVCGLAYWVGYDAWIGPGPSTLALVFFPLLIVSSLRVPPLAKLLSARPFMFLGDISYAVYLVHVPMQMIVLAVVQKRHVSLPVTTNGFFFAYAATVIALATATYYGLERPAQRWLRRRLRTTTPPVAALSPDPA